MAKPTQSSTIRGPRSVSLNTRPKPDIASDPSAGEEEAAESGYRRRQPRRAVKSAMQAAHSYESDPLAHDFTGHSGESSGSRHVRSHSVSSFGSDDVRYTKTGRVSKALKGKRVHQCEVCGKSYTRAEHMRRHRLNHEGQVLQCNVGGCTRQFVRSDLLLRHREEHNMEPPDASSDMINRDAGFPAFTAAHGEPYATVGPTGAGNTTATRDESPYPSFGDSSMPVKEPYFDTTVPYQSYSITCDGPYGTSIGVSSNDWDPMSYKSSPSLFGTPAPDQFGEGPQDAFFGSHVVPTHLSNTFLLEDFGNLKFDFSGTDTPASVTSSAVPMWSQLEEQLRFRGMASTPNSTASFPTTHTQSTSMYEAHGLVGGPGATISDAYFSFQELDQSEAVRIANKISGLPGVTLDSDGTADLGHLYDAYLASYWDKFHPLFPVVHRPSFAANPAPPLLKSLMTAIGASYHENLEAKLLARSLREACFGLLDKRPAMPFAVCRIWDLLTIFLAEVFQLYRARRPLLRLSSRFEDMLSGLQNDTHMFARDALDEVLNLPCEPQPEMLEQLRIDWINDETKRRLYLACSLIELQHKSFFQPSFQIPDRDLSPPCTTALWEATTETEWYEQAKCELPRETRLYDAIIGYALENSPAFDSFESALIVTHASRRNDALPYPIDESHLDAIEQHPRTMFLHHATSLAKLTPIWDLLAVSGESFVLGNKLATRAQHNQAKADLLAWTRSVPAQRAVRHAIEALRIVHAAGKCELLCAEWVLYLSALVVWAVGRWPALSAVPGDVAGKLSALGPARATPPANGNLGAAATPAQPVVLQGQLQLGEAMAAFLASTESASASCNAFDPDGEIVLDPVGVSSCLLWTRKQISGQLGGLVEDAMVVLGKLADGTGVV